MSDFRAGPPKPSLAEAKKNWRTHNARLADGAVLSDLDIGIAATFTADTLVPFLGSYLLDTGTKPNIRIGPYNQIFQVCLDHKSYFGDNCDVVIILWRLEELVQEDIQAFLLGDPSALSLARSKITFLVSALAELRSRFSGMVIASLPPYPVSLPAYTSDLGNPGGMGSFHRILNSDFVEQTSAVQDLKLFDLDAYQRQFGLAESFDVRQWYLYRQPFHEWFLSNVGIGLGRLVMARRRASRKCIVLDCDNTLWGGIVGEDGLDGLKIGDEFPGSAFRDFQKQLLYWRGQGVLLALSSKNNEADVWEVFERHSGMVLKREHISTSQVNWSPKPENIARIARDLNIGVESLVFIDDNPMEVNFMRSARPEVLVVQFPEEPEQVINMIRGLSCFDRLEITGEDRTRADMMRAEKNREEIALPGMSKQDFYRALELRIDLFRATHEHFDRIAQLINKTNQFNLTTRRRSLDEVRALAAEPDFRIFGLRVKDKFGDYGLTGVVLTTISENGRVWEIDTLLLSCRVLGRGVETSMLANLAAIARSEGGQDLFASFIPSAKNAPSASFLSDHGFVQTSDQRWFIELSNVPQPLSELCDGKLN